MSAETPSWKTGADHASVSRRAIVLRIEVSGTTSTSPVGERRWCGRRGCGCGGASGGAPLDVVGEDPALRARSLERREIDPALARHAPGERRLP